MIVVGLIMSDMPPFTGKWFRICIYLNTKWIRNSLGILLKGKLFHIDPILYFSAWIFLPVSETCSLELSRLTCGPSCISCINSWSGENSPSTCRFVIQKPLFIYYIYIYLKDLNIVLAFLSARYLTTVKIILRIR